MPDNPIPDRWVNAVAEFRVPMDIPIDATPEQKVEAVVAAFGEDFPAQFDGADLRWEDVEDGEPIRDESSETDPIPDHVIEQAARILDPMVFNVLPAAAGSNWRRDGQAVAVKKARAVADVLVAYGREQERREAWERIEAESRESQKVEPVGISEQLPDHLKRDHSCHQHCPCQMVTVTLSREEIAGLADCLDWHGTTEESERLVDKLRAALEGDQ